MVARIRDSLLMVRLMKRTPIFLSLGLLLASCSSKPSSLIPSTSPIPDGIRGTIPAYGSDCQTYLLGIVPVTGSPDSQVALQRAKKSADVDVLTDVTVDHGGGYYILISNSCVRIQGMGVPRDVLAEATARR